MSRRVPVRGASIFLAAVLYVVAALLLTRISYQAFRFEGLAFFYAAVALCATRGLGCGLAATTLSAASIQFLLPASMFGSSGEDVARAVAFTLVAILIVWLAHGRRSSHRRLQHLTAELEQRVEERTRDLADRNQRLEQAVEQQRQAEQALRESETHFREMANRAPVMIRMIGSGGQVTFLNDAWLHFTGCPLADDCSDGWCDDVHAEDRSRCLSTYASAFDQRREFKLEYRLLHRDGSYRWVLDHGAPVFRGGEFTGYIASAFDITERRELEEQRLKLAEEQHARSRAEVANRAKDELIAVLSHELRTPLTPVTLILEQMERDGRLPKDLRDDVRMMRRNLELETHLIDDLLDITKIKKGKVRLQLATEDAHDLIRQAHDMIKPDLAGRRLDVVLDMNAEHHHVRADARRLQQVFWNLLKNAIKFTPDGGRICVRTTNAPAGQVRVDVIDSGIGIEPDVLQRIFAAFEQGESATPGRFGGLGLGLAICKALVEMHGGELHAASRGKGEGASFTVQLKAVPATVSAHVRTSAETQPSRQPPRRILLVEDDPTTSKAMTRLLKSLGHDVTPAPDVHEALAAASSRPFDLVISDIGLPDGTGLDLMRQLRDRHGLRGIAVSGYGMAHDVHQSLSAGFDSHLTKPLTIEKVEAAIRQLRL